MNTNQVFGITQLTLAVVAAFTLTGQADARSRTDRVVVVRPAELPELAQVPDKARTVHATSYGRTILYIEQNHSARKNVFYATDPTHFKPKRSAQVDAPGSLNLF